jgi:Ice-binding-like/Bacterial Ig-like domain
MMKLGKAREAYPLFLLLLAGFFIAGCDGGAKTGHWLPRDTTAPAVSLVAPANAATNVPTGNRLTATFSEAMDPTTISTTTFTVSDGESVVLGTVTYSGVTAVFTPTSPLSVSTTYYATITTGARDLAGNALSSDYAWSFTTGVVLTADVTKPRVSRTVNDNGATGVPINTKVGATFSEAMDPATITTTTFTLRQGTTVVPGTVAYSGVNAVFTPTDNLALSTLYTARITTGATDLAGNALAGNQASLPAASDYVWSWTTGATADNTAPSVILTYPVDNATNVAINSAVTATFSEAMDPLTITTATFTVTDNVGAPVAGTVAYLDNVATFTPTANLPDNTSFTATITTGAADLAGNALAPGVVPNPWIFNTGAGLAPSGIALGSAGTFGTFGGSAGMTNQGTLTIINGDIGTIATGTTSVTGFHDTEGDIFTETGSNIGGVNGTIYTCTHSTTGPTSAGVNAAYCSIATQARLDAQTAYLALAGMPSTGVLAGNLAGTTIPPGVYTNASSVLIQGGDLTLDAGGDANAVFVFQIGSTLTVGGPGAAFPQSIILSGNAQPKNVFWQVGTAATINAGGGGTMVGTIISQAGVTFSTAGNVALVTLNGRALSLGASVTMVNTVVNVPAP